MIQPRYLVDVEPALACSPRLLGFQKVISYLDEYGLVSLTSFQRDNLGAQGLPQFKLRPLLTMMRHRGLRAPATNKNVPPVTLLLRVLSFAPGARSSAKALSSVTLHFPCLVSLKARTERLPSQHRIDEHGSCIVFDGP